MTEKFEWIYEVHHNKTSKTLIVHLREDGIRDELAQVNLLYRLGQTTAEEVRFYNSKTIWIELILGLPCESKLVEWLTIINNEMERHYGKDISFDALLKKILGVERVSE